MEFQEAVTRLMIHNKTSSIQKEKQKWKTSTFHRSPNQKTAPTPVLETPTEFLCPISGTLMNNPVIVSSGHTFDRACVQACITLGFSPTLMDGTTPNFSTVIPNLALKSTILKWCKKHSLDPSISLDFFSAEKLVRSKILLETQQHRGQDNAVASDLITDQTSVTPDSWSSDDSPVPSSSLADIETLNPNYNPTREEEFVRQIKSPLVFEIEQGLVSLRKTTRSAKEDDTCRSQLCTSRLLSALQPLIISRYANIQVNSVACLVNLSLEKRNKVKIVRSGILPLLIGVLKGGFPEAKEHACGAIFSLALDDCNKTAIGVLGALPPLLHLLRSGESDRTRHESALALYHLSLTQSNIAKLVKLGSVPILVGIIKSGENMEISRILLILCNLALSPNGRAAICNSGGVEALVDLLRGSDELKSEICVWVFHGLSHGGLRFKWLAKAAGAAEVLEQVEKTGNERVKENVRRIFELMETPMEEEDVLWEDLLADSG